MLVLKHPAFKDVYMIVKKRYYVKEKDIYKLSVIWMHLTRGHALTTEKLVVTAAKYNEFEKERWI
jgi:hypothetical protein